MKFSGYFCFVAAAILVVFAQQSEAGTIFDKITNYIEDRLDAIENKLEPGIKRFRDTITFIQQLVQENLNGSIYVDPLLSIREGFINTAQILSNSRTIMLDRVSAGERIIVGKNPAGARKLTQQVSVDGISIAYSAGTPFFKALGGALGLSNGAREGLLSASKILQKGGWILLDIIASAESLFNDGSEAGGRAADVSLEVYRSAMEAAYAGIFYNLQKSTNESLQALKDAESKPMKVQTKNVNCGAAAKDDPESSDALKDINQIAKNALRNGANPALVQQLKKIIKCSLDSLVQISVEARRMIGNTKTIARIDTFAATTMFFKETKGLKKTFNQLAASLFLGIGDVYVKSGNQSDKEIQSGFTVVEKGNIKFLKTIKFSEQIVENGLQNGGDASMLAIETAAESVNYGKLVFIQGIVECSRIVFNLL